MYIDYAGHNNIMEIMSVDRYIKKLSEYIQYLDQYHAEKQKIRHIQPFQGENIENSAIEIKHKSAPPTVKQEEEKEKHNSVKSTK